MNPPRILCMIAWLWLAGVSLLLALDVVSYLRQGGLAGLNAAFNPANPGTWLTILIIYTPGPALLTMARVIRRRASRRQG